MRQRLLMIVLTVTFGSLLLACGLWTDMPKPTGLDGPPEGTGAATPAELLDRYRDLHARKDTAALRDLELWSGLPLNDPKPDATAAAHENGWKDLFSLDLLTARIDEVPPRDTATAEIRGQPARWPHHFHPGPQYVTLDHGGEARFVVCEADYTWDGTHGKLLLSVRGPGGRQLDVDPGVAIVRWGGRYFLSPMDEVLRDAVDAARAGRPSRFRAVPLGIDLQGLAGLTPGWERVERLLDEVNRERAGRLPGGKAGPP